MSADSSLSLKLGQIVITPNALARLTKIDITLALTGHVIGNWGDLDAEDKLANDLAVVQGGRVLSAHSAANGVRFWIITEADRSATTILLPEDY